MKWMIDITFHADRQAEVAALVPQEQAHIKELREKGVVENLYISASRGHVWLIIHADSQAQVEQELSALPLYPYMQFEITQLVG
jgi:muconolactone delta-isomerase